MAIVTGFESCDDRACADIFCDDRHTPVLINTGVVNLEKNPHGKKTFLQMARPTIRGIPPLRSTIVPQAVLSLVNVRLPRSGMGGGSASALLAIGIL